jgi:hypothetical protein
LRGQNRRAIDSTRQPACFGPCCVYFRRHPPATASVNTKSLRKGRRVAGRGLRNWAERAEGSSSNAGPVSHQQLFIVYGVHGCRLFLSTYLLSNTQCRRLLAMSWRRIRISCSEGVAQGAGFIQTSKRMHTYAAEIESQRSGTGLLAAVEYLKRPEMASSVLYPVYMALLL